MNNLIDKGTHYEIENYSPIVSVDGNGDVSGVIFCPYIPKFLVDGAELDSNSQ
jgi:hypothetical protein